MIKKTGKPIEGSSMKVSYFLSKKKILGLFLLIFGITILLMIIFPRIDINIMVFVALMSVMLIVKAFETQGSKRYIIPGLMFLLISIFLILYYLFFEDEIELKRIWPILGIFPGISLIVYYIMSKTRSLATIIPGIFILLLSLVILMITIGVINISFRTFLALLVSGMIIITGLYFVFNNEIKFFQKHIKKKKLVKKP
jgi:hypothetical protein